MQAEEEADDKIEDATLRKIVEGADGLAVEVAPIIANDWVNKKRIKHMAVIDTTMVKGGDGFFGGK